MSDEELREEIKQLRSNNRSYAQILTSQSIDALISFIREYGRRERLDELKHLAWDENMGSVTIMTDVGSEEYDYINVDKRIVKLEAEARGCMA